MDNMIAMMEKYTDHLEETVLERTQQLEEEKLKTDALLYRMLPKQEFSANNNSFRNRVYFVIAYESLLGTNVVITFAQQFMTFDI